MESSITVSHRIQRRTGSWSAALRASVLVLALATTSAWSRAASADRLARNAVTLLRDECLSCHGETKQKGGLSLLTREQLLKGAEEGPGV